MNALVNESHGKFFYVILAFFVFVPLIALGDNPGLYFDAINPDYVAVQLLHPHNPYFVNWQFANPILFMMYCGSINVLMTLVDIILTGKTSVLQHHIESGVVIFLALIIMYKILKCHFGNQRRNKILIAMIGAMPCLISFSLTQEFMFLPGTCFVLFSFLLYEKMRGETVLKNSLLLLAALFYILGWAFYTYFVFLFFFPSFLILAVVHKSKAFDRFVVFIVSSFSFLSGAVLYPIGYLQAFLQRENVGNLSLPFGLLVFLIVYGLSVLLLVLALYKKNKTFLVASVVAVLIGIIFFILFLYKFYPILRELTQALNVLGTNANLKTRLLKVFCFTKAVFSGTNSENLMYGMVKTKFQFVIFYAFIIQNILYFIYLAITRRWKDSFSLRLILIVIVYCLCSLKFVTRMGAHHFVPLVFLLFLLSAAEINEMAPVIKTKKSVFAAYVFAVFFLLANICDRYMVVNYTLYTGGQAESFLYSNQLNKLAYDAIDNVHNGKKEIYIFPEWGFFTGFCYLTENHIPFWTDSSDGALEKFAGEGYDVVICSWRNIKEYENRLTNLGFDIETNPYFQNNGNVAFYKVTGRRDKFFSSHCAVNSFKKIVGFFHDGWISGKSEMLINSDKDAKLQLDFYNPSENDTQENLEIFVDGLLVSSTKVRSGKWTVEAPISATELSRVEIVTSYRQKTTNGDERPLSLLLSDIRFAE